MTSERNTPAFISQGAFEIDGQLSAGVVTAFSAGEGQVEIVIQPLVPIAGYEIKVWLDHEDLASVNELLRRQAEEEDDEAEDA